MHRRILSFITIFILIGSSVLNIDWSAGGTVSNTFAEGASEELREFPFGGGEALFNVSFPGTSRLVAASVNLTGLPTYSNYSLVQTTDAEFISAEEKSDVTVENGSVSLCQVGWSCTQNKTEDFQECSKENVTVQDGVSLLTQVGENTPDQYTVGLWHCNEGTGTQVSDASTINNGATFAGSPTWVDGRFGKAVALDGIGDRLRIQHIPQYEMTNLTVEAWIKTTAQNGWIISNGQMDNVAWELVLGNGKLSCRIATSEVAGTFPLITSTPINDGLWHHIAMTYDGSTYSLYIDGVVGQAAMWEAQSRITMSP